MHLTIHTGEDFTMTSAPDLLINWAAAHQIPLDPAEPVTTGPWAEWDAHRDAVYLGEWMTERCPRCGQLDRPQAPLIPPSGHADWSRQHGCGGWWAPAQLRVDDLTTEALDQALAELRSEELAAREKVRRRLRSDLARVLAEPGDDREATGDQTQPGVYVEDGQWIAWDYDPFAEGEPITVYADELR